MVKMTHAPAGTSAGRNDVSGAAAKASAFSLPRLLLGASISSIAMAGLAATPAHAQIVITDNTPVDNPGGQTVTSADGVTQTVDSGDNIELENDTNDGTVITLGGTHINNDNDDEDVVVFIDNSEDEVVVNVLSTGVLQGSDGVIFFEGDEAVLVNDGLIAGTGEAAEAVVYFDRDADGNVNTVTNNGTITSVGGATIGVDTLLGTDPSSGTVGDEEGITRFTLINTGMITNTGTDGDADAIHFNGDPGTTGGEARGCLEQGGAFVLCQVEVSITNSGTISADQTSTNNAAIRSESDAVLLGTITNEAGGVITAGSNAIRINGAHADHDLTISNAGTINGLGNAGIQIGGAGVTVENLASGVIMGATEGIRLAGDTIDIDIGPSNMDDVAVAASGNTITNAGTISGSLLGVLIGDNAAGTSVTNTGMITGQAGFESSSGGTLINNGMIDATNGFAVEFTGDADAAVTLGADSSISSSDSVAVLFGGAGTNTLNVVAGAAVSDDLIGSTAAGATNVLNLSGSADDTSDIQAFDFGQVNVDGGVFNLTQNANGIGDIALNSGTLFVNAIGETGAITVGAAGVLGGNGNGGATTVADGGVINPGNLGSADQLNLTSLALSSGSILAFDLGDPGVPNSSDLLNVAGDLTLDGTLNVTDAGNFGLGVYTLITYGGALTDNGLDVGVVPDGFEVAQGEVQTSVGGQVNFVVTSLTTVSDDAILFFDGANIAADDVIDGGAGTWNADGNNWTNAAGDVNSLWNSQFAVFSGTAGTVTIEGDIEAIGLQFLTDGYVIDTAMGTLALTDAVSNVRVGDAITATIAAPLVGDGGINKVEGGTLILTGDNTYTGATTVAGGTLVLDGSLVSATSVSAGATLAGTGSSTGAVTVSAGGTVAPGLDGTVGTLTVGDLALSENSILAFDLGAPDTDGASDRIQVNGDLTLDGLLNAADIGGFGLGVYRLIDYTGTLTDAGLIVNALPDGFASEQGSIQITVDGQVNLIIDRAIPSIQFFDGADTMGNGSIDGGSGSWNLTDTNWTDANGEFNAAWNSNFAVFAGTAGTVTVDDAISFTGLQFMTDGYTIASGTGALTIMDALTAVRVDPGVTATISAPIGGDGGLNKLDSGTLILDGDHTYTGDTVVDGGLFVVNGSIASAVTVNDGGMLGGSGQLGGINVIGTLAPGNSIGTLNVAGDINFATTSMFDVEIAPDGTSDLVAATGAASIDGGTVNVIADTMQFNVSTDYTILTADGGVTGTFDSVNSNLAFLTPTLSYGFDSVMLNVTRNDVAFAAVGQTANQIAVGEALESQGAADLVNAIVNLDAATARDAFDQLSGEVHPSARTVMIEDQRLVRNAVLNHLSYEEGGNIWGQAWGVTGDTDGNGNATGLSRDGFGFLLGADVSVGEGASLGVTGSYSESDFDLDPRAGTGTSNLGEGTIETLTIVGYVGVDLGAIRVRAGGGYGSSEVSTDRNVSFGAFTDTLTADYDGSVTFGFVEAGFPIEMTGGTFEPYVGLNFGEASTDGFVESGGSAALRLAEDIENSSNAIAGLRYATDGSGSFQLRANAGYQQGLNDLDSESTVRLDTGNAFTIAGAERSRSAGFLQAEASMKLSDNSSIGLSYDGVYGDASQDHAGVVRVTIGF